MSCSTALTAAHGHAEAAKIITGYVEIAHEALEPGARIVERVGDELLIVGEHVASGSTIDSWRFLHLAGRRGPSRG